MAAAISGVGSWATWVYGMGWVALQACSSPGKIKGPFYLVKIISFLFFKDNFFSNHLDKIFSNPTHGMSRMMTQGEGKHSRYANLLYNVDHFTIIMANVSLRCKRYNILSVSLIALKKTLNILFLLSKNGDSLEP